VSHYSDVPGVGYYKVRQVRGGPWIAARIWLDDDRYEPGNPENRLDRSPILRAEIGGEEVEVERIGVYAETIDVAEYQFLLASARHADKHRPESPEANPKQGVDLGAMKPIF
jgi:hypothetical protein